MNKFILFGLCSLSFFLVLSCQTHQAANQSATSTNPAEVLQAKNRHDLIKEEKRRQSEADLPFRGLDLSKKLDVIAFGSCADQDQPQPLWDTVAKQNPDLFLFTGDNIYASSPKQKLYADQYRKLNKISEYRNIREKVPFMAIWDDHDFGQNDGGASNSDKENSRNEFLKYWSYLRASLPKQQKALFHSRIIGSKKNTVQIIMLDTRWDRSDLKPNPEDLVPVPVAVAGSADTSTPQALIPKVPSPYLADDDKSKHFLSNEQWSWLEAELRKPAALRILVSSIQVIADDHHFEKWGNFPKEKEKLFNLLKTTKAKNLFIVSGDRHIGTIAQTEIAGLGKIYDITASAINRPPRPGNILKDSSYLKDAYADINFGTVKIDWDHRKAILELHALDNSVVNSAEVKF